jgi:predicted MPP superfamily phosphohydrolase
MDDSEALQAEQPEPTLGRLPLLSILKGILLALFAVGVIVLGHAYVAARIVGGLRLTGVAAEAGWVAVWTLFASLFAAFLTRRLPRRATVPLRWISYCWMGLFALLLVTTGGVDLASVALCLLRGLPLAGRFGPLEVAIVLGFVAPAFVWGAVRALGPARIEHVKIPIAGLPQDLQGYRIVQISDLHIGETLGRAFCERLVGQVNALHPDAIAVTGDLADGGVAQLRGEVAPLAGLKARDGVYFVTGNHEYYSGLASWLAEVQRLGMKVLLNEHQVISRGQAQLVIAGVTDYNGGQMAADHGSRPDLALAGAPHAPRILLAHQPRTAFHASGLGIDLQLSGHTHGGQFFPWKYLVRLQQPVLSGLAQIGGVRVYTHRGTGFWGPPLRLLAPPEIAEIELTAALIDNN